MAVRLHCMRRDKTAEHEPGWCVVAGTPHGRTFLRDVGWVLSQQQGGDAASLAAPVDGARQGPLRAAMLAKSLFELAQSHGWQQLAGLFQGPYERGLAALRVASAAAAAAGNGAAAGPGPAAAAQGAAAGEQRPLGGPAAAAAGELEQPPSSAKAASSRGRTAASLPEMPAADGAVEVPEAPSGGQQPAGEPSGSEARLAWAALEELMGGEAEPGPTEEEVLAMQLVRGELPAGLRPRRAPGQGQRDEADPSKAEKEGAGADGAAPQAWPRREPALAPAAAAAARAAGELAAGARAGGPEGAPGGGDAAAEGPGQDVSGLGAALSLVAAAASWTLRAFFGEV
jgi:hypothetical protein